MEATSPRFSTTGPDSVPAGTLTFTSSSLHETTSFAATPLNVTSLLYGLVPKPLPFNATTSPTAATEGTSSVSSGLTPPIRNRMLCRSVTFPPTNAVTEATYSVPSTRFQRNVSTGTGPGRKLTTEFGPTANVRCTE